MTAIDRPDWNSSAPSAGGVLVVPAGLVGVPGSGSARTPGAFVGNLQAVVVQLGMPVQFTFLAEWLFSLDNVAFSPYYLPNVNLETAVTYEQVIPVLGPYFSVELVNGTGLNESVEVTIFGVPAGLPNDGLIPPTAVVDQQAVALGASAMVLVVPTLVAPGQYALMALCNQNVAVQVQYWTGAAWHPVADFRPLASTPLDAEVILPAADVRLAVTNLTATATTFNLALVGPL